MPKVYQIILRFLMYIIWNTYRNLRPFKDSITCDATAYRSRFICVLAAAASNTTDIREQQIYTLTAFNSVGMAFTFVCARKLCSFLAIYIYYIGIYTNNTHMMTRPYIKAFHKFAAFVGGKIYFRHMLRISTYVAYVCLCVCYCLNEMTVNWYRTHSFGTNAAISDISYCQIIDNVLHNMTCSR